MQTRGLRVLRFYSTDERIRWGQKSTSRLRIGTEHVHARRIMVATIWAMHAHAHPQQSWDNIAAYDLKSIYASQRITNGHHFANLIIREIDSENFFADRWIITTDPKHPLCVMCARTTTIARLGMPDARIVNHKAHKT